MSTAAASPDPSLEALLLTFDADPAGNRAAVRNVLDHERGSFYASAIEILKTRGDAPGTQCLIELIAANGMLIATLCDPALTQEQAVVIGRAAVRMDPTVDATLARTLADSTLGTGDPIPDPARLMEVLSQIGDSSRILPYLMRMLRHQSPHMRSKVVKMIGRGSRSVKWIRAKLSEADPRVRANAVEALWGMDTPEARALLHFATNDANNRVLGNALVGLYYLGDSSVLEQIVKMSAHEAPLFRATAAWVMGETGDVRFSDIVRRLLLQQEPLVRKRALVALGRIKQANAAARGSQLHIAGSMEAGATINSVRRLMAAVASSNATELKKIAPIHFVLCEGGRYVTSYKVSEKPLADSISVIFVIPRAAEPGFTAGVLSCLSWKRPSDRWCILPYDDSGETGEPPDTPPPQFTASAETVEAWFRDASHAYCPDLWTVLSRATKPAGLPSRGRRYVIILSRTPETAVAGPDLVANIVNGRIGVQVISSMENPQMAAFCRRTHSLYTHTAQNELPDVIRQAYLRLLARYEITYQPVAAQSAELKLRVQSPDGWAETVVAIPPPE